MQGLLPGEANRALNLHHPMTMEELYHVLEEYARGEHGNNIKRSPSQLAKETLGARKYENPPHKKFKGKTNYCDWKIMAIDTPHKKVPTRGNNSPTK